MFVVLETVITYVCNRSLCSGLGPTILQ